MPGAREWISLVYWSELNILLGLGTLCLVTDPRLGIRDGIGSQEFGAPLATRAIRRQLGLLWAVKQGAVVASVYVLASVGVGTAFWALAGAAAALYVISYLLVADRLAAIEADAGFGVGAGSLPSTMLYLVSYISVVNWALANPFRVGSGPKVLYSVALLANLVAAAIVIGVLSVDSPLIDAWGCYPVATSLDALDVGMCPSSPLGSYRTCLELPGTSLCQTLKGNTLFVSAPYRVARTIVAISVAVYFASFSANFRRLEI